MVDDSLCRRLRLPELVVAATALLVLLLGADASQAKPSSGESRANARVSIGHQRSLGKGPACKLARRAVGRRTSRQRRRDARRAQRCHRDRATKSAPPVSLYWGASIGDQISGEQVPWDMGALSQFEGMVGKPLSLVHFMAPFANCPSGGRCSYYDFPTGEMESIREHGAIPFFSWSSQSIPSSLDEPDFQLGDVIAGTYDSYIREWATAAKEWGHPFFLRFNWEMNGNWFPWSEGVNGNGPGESVAAWRHVHDIFNSVGAGNVSWVWCPNVDPGNKMQDIGSLYPGDEYVDWTSLDGYNWGTNPARPGGWKTFDELYSSTYHRIVDTIAPSKPMVIGEVGSTEYGGSKATWIQEMLSELPTNYPKIRGLVWFEKFDDGMDWPIETSASSTSAFAAGIQSPAYVGDQYADLGGGPIQPPS
jgi:mannan endo-1,4-beta-mannosidase